MPYCITDRFKEHEPVFHDHGRRCNENRVNMSGLSHNSGDDIRLAGNIMLMELFQ